MAAALAGGGTTNPAIAAALSRAERAHAAASSKSGAAALKAEALRARSLEAAVQLAEREEILATRALERAKNNVRSLEQQQETAASTYKLYKHTQPLYDTLEAGVTAARSVQDVLAALAAAVSAQKETAEADVAARDAYRFSGEVNVAKMTELSAAKQHAATTLKMLKELIKNPRNLPRPVALSAWYASSREVVERLRRNAAMAGQNARGVEQRYFTASVWPSPEFFDTRCTAEADYTADAATYYQQKLMATRATAGAKRKAEEALGSGAAPVDCSCCLSSPAVFVCASGHANYCVDCMHFLVDATLRPEVQAGTRLLEGAVGDVDAAALQPCCTPGCGRHLHVRDVKARILGTLGSGNATPADVLHLELLYGKVGELAARSAVAQLQRELAAKLGAQSAPEPAEVKAFIKELINVVKCPNCEAAYYGVTEACQHAYCPCRPSTAFCAFCFQNHSDYQNCVLYPRYADDDAVAAPPEDPEAVADVEGQPGGAQNGAANERFNKHKAACVMKAHHINRLLASASSSTIRAVLVDAEVLQWLREIHVTVDAAVCGAEAEDFASCPLNIDGIGSYVCSSIRRSFAHTFEACRNKPYANNHELDTLMRRANEAERAAERAAALCATLAVFDAPFTTADFEARLDQLRHALSSREAGTFPFRLPRSIAAARSAVAACTVGMGGDARRVVKAKVEALAEQSSAAFVAYKAHREAARMRKLRGVIIGHVAAFRHHRRWLRQQAKDAPKQLRHAQNGVTAADAVRWAAVQGAAAARALRDAALSGQGSAAALPAVAAAVAATAALGRREEPREQQERTVVRLGAGAVTSQATSEDDEEHEATLPPRQRRRLWHRAASPDASSGEDAVPPRVRRRFRRQATPLLDGSGDDVTAEEEGPERRPWSPADTPEPPHDFLFV